MAPLKMTKIVKMFVGDIVLEDNCVNCESKAL